jgi:hypothetical protein
MAASRRYRCGECAYRPRGVSAAESAERLAEHYAACHPGVPGLGGAGFRRARRREVIGCLLIMATLLLLLFIAAASH